MPPNLSCPYVPPEGLREKNEGLTDWHCPNPSFSPYSQDGPHCILHYRGSKEDPEGVRKFNDALQEKQDAVYWGYVFPRGFDTTLLRLKNADFREAHFSDDADFSKCTFEGITFFNGVSFKKNANFSGAAFCENVSFASAVFCGEANFRNARFLGLHKGNATNDVVRDALMFGAVNFREVSFEQGADFTDAKFMVTSSFWKTTFSGDAVFSETEFGEGADVEFSSTTFGKYCYFIKAQIRSKITFLECVFQEEAVFRNAAFQGFTHFHASTFERVARFGNYSLEESEERRLNLRFVEMDMERVAFRSANLREVSFHNCSSLDKTEFFACLWNKAFNRQRVHCDELAVRGCKPKWGSREAGVIKYTPPSDEEWERVENTYRDLRRNFEDRRDYAGANEFYVGEMEMRRLAKPRLERELLSLEALYRHLSTYGENWWKPLLYLFGLLVISSFVYAGWPTDYSTLFLSLLHSLSVLTLLRISVAEPLHWSGQLMAILQLVLSPILITLSVLAIRRKLKR